MDTVHTVSEQQQRQQQQQQQRQQQQQQQHPFHGPLSGTTQGSRYQKGKTNLDFTEARDTVSGSGISWAICKSAPSSRQIITPAPHHSVFLQAGRPSCSPTNSVKALKARCVSEMIHKNAVYFRKKNTALH